MRAKWEIKGIWLVRTCQIGGRLCTQEMRAGGGYSVSNCYQGRDLKMCSAVVINLGSSQGVWVVLLLSFSEGN